MLVISSCLVVIELAGTIRYMSLAYLMSTLLVIIGTAYAC